MSKRVSKTRDHILATALRLFNELGTAVVSTNHIAEASEISPGNLYYHFRNKEEIIHELFEQRFSRADSLGNFIENRLPTLDDMRQIVRDSFELNWEYRFIFRELIVLLRREPKLQKRWIEVRQRGFDGFQSLIGAFVQAGILRAPADQNETDQLAELCWMIAELWLPNIEILGHDVNAAEINRGVELMLHVLDPYVIQSSATKAKTVETRRSSKRK